MMRLLLLTIQKQWPYEYCDIMPGVPTTVILTAGEPSSSTSLMIWGRRDSTSFFQYVMKEPAITAFAALDLVWKPNLQILEGSILEPVYSVLELIISA